MLRPQEVEGRPHWEVRFSPEVWPYYEEFREFLCKTWDHLGLPDPTTAQLEMAHRLQYGVDTAEWDAIDPEALGALLAAPREDIIRALRGLGKSFVTAAFAIWLLMRNPRDEHILVVSATGKKAKEFVDMVKGLMASMPMLNWLLEGARENGARRRDQADEFDVAGAAIRQSKSLQARGMTGQITGCRATTLIADDIEIKDNSKTVDAREGILHTVRTDFVPITKTEHGKGDIFFLGTPQTEESVYNVLVIEMGFRCMCIPARFPTEEKLKNYTLQLEDGSAYTILAHYLIEAHEDGRIGFGHAVDERFCDDELTSIESKGRATFALQYMLDTSLSDAERYPLKQSDLIIFPAHHQKAPTLIQWGHHTDGKNQIHDIPNLGFSGDHFLRPLKVDDEDWRDYERSVLFVDPAGRGKDEMAWSVVKELNAMFFACEVEGQAGDPEAAMWEIARRAKHHNVNTIEVEPNYGQGIWLAAFKPIIMKVWPGREKHYRVVDGERVEVGEGGGCTIVETEWAKGQKETRIIDTLEPVMNTHRLVMAEHVMRSNTDDHLDRDYSLLYQLTHITRERGSLKHEDRLETLSGAIYHFLNTVSVDAAKAHKAMKEEDMQREIDAYEEYCTGSFKQGNIRRSRGRRLDHGEHAEVIRWGSF